jgi:hypothetical protein
MRVGMVRSKEIYGYTIFEHYMKSVADKRKKIDYIYVSSLVAGPFTMITRIDGDRNITPGGICLQMCKQDKR